MTSVSIRDILKEVSAAAADCGSGTPEMDEAVEQVDSLLAVWDAGIDVLMIPRNGHVIVTLQDGRVHVPRTGEGFAVRFEPGPANG